MDVIVTVEQRFARTPDGAVWTGSTFAPEFWERYLRVFDRVRVVARAAQVSRPAGSWRRVDGPRTEFVPLPHYMGPWQYAARSREINRSIQRAVRPQDAVVLRVGSPIAARVEARLNRMRHPYAVEVVGDPWDVFAPGAVRHPLRAFFRWWFSRQLLRQCAGACAAAYVTQGVLQRRYPPASEAFVTSYSSVELHPEAFVARPREAGLTAARHSLIGIGSLEQMYKAPDVLLRAVARCVEDGLDVGLVYLGDGRCRASLRALAVQLGLGQRVVFRGQVPPGADVRTELDRADLFVIPSRTEGLPRSLIEAMARGLPALGSTAGGIPELLEDADLVPVEDVDALARKIREVLLDPRRRAEMSARNLSRSRDYGAEHLARRRDAFYASVRDRTGQWITARAA